MSLRLSLCMLVLGIGLAMGDPAGAGPGNALRRKGRITVKTGYIDAHFAVSPDGKYLAYVHVGEGTKPTSLHIMSISGRPRRLAKVNISKFTNAPVRLQFTPDSRRVLIVAEMHGKVANPPRKAVLYDHAGRPSGKLSQFHRLVLVKTKAGWEFVTYLQKTVGQRLYHEIARYKASPVRRIKIARLTSDRSLTVTRPKMEIAFWRPDYLHLVAKVAGQYDRQRDVRLPDREKIYDVFTRKFVSDREIQDLQGWMKLKQIREKAPTPANLLRLTGTQQSFTFELITPKNERVGLGDISPSLKQFDFNSFVQKRGAKAGEVIFSLTIDPQWPTIEGRKVNVPEVLHLFRFDAASRRTSLVGTVPSPGQVLGWSLGKNRAAIMRLHKYWRLGHTALEIYAVP